MPYYSTGYVTQTAGTEITSICPPNQDMIPVLRGFSYAASSTEHQAYVMSARGMTTTISFTDAAGTTLELAKIDPGVTSAGERENLATDDFVAYQTRYGDIEVRKISSVSASTITVAATTSPVDTGAKVWAFYQLGGTGNIQIRCAASITTTFDTLSVQAGIPRQKGLEMQVSGMGMPLLFAVDNGTNAGKLDWVCWEWVPSSNEFLL